MRISIKHLLLLVSAIAFAIASLRHSGPFLAALMMTMSFVVYLGMVVTLVSGKGSYPNFAAGFLVCSSYYVALLALQDENRLSEEIARMVWPIFVSLESTGDQSRWDAFKLTVHLWLAISFGWMGGMFTLYLCQKREKERVNGI